ncbi:C40 family peptidase [Capnocytophaga catalasegens]|uniref:Hydrolase Nlp/P60 n=1 Tax=Capnocytophaga catalasegens TaxID=1004260 RepID=A0AAV5B0J1_9FLAO|nr:C40 family peptidase [Capnocytophaga catalasegens]GIZ16154.1 hydrolase Nlp/P60 [Capnocytophaga catalasegens]GJM50902.1 hydrolase Nlp/P60 [Capnocytophaga catalasegens]GJM53746.1 hydrolase Nlp/P60 [Capnocytophaga catalasegens]
MYALCNLSVVPIREEASHKSQQITQILYGDVCFIIRKQDNWLYVRIDFDQYEGWVDEKQVQPIDEQTYREIKETPPRYASDLVDFVQSIDDENQLQPICIGATTSNSHFLGQLFTGDIQQGVNRKDLIEIAYKYLNAPYQWGGKSPFGIDCSGLVQMIYKLIGISIPRDAYQQSGIGHSVDFIEETKAGDLVFFDNFEGQITHVGMIIQKNYIIHAHGKVRIDALDHNGIYNIDFQKYTHKLRMIKRILPNEEK